MSGWGRVSCLVGVGTLVALGCGGRTGALEGDYGVGADNTGADGGSSHRGGAAANGGTVPSGGALSSAGGPAYPTGGSYAVGGYGYGAYPATGGVVSYGGYPSGGAISYGGVSYGGYPAGGSFGYAGTFASGGGAPIDCLSCLNDACAPVLVECLQDFGCLSILGCLQSTGCQGFQCYSDQYCKGTIDQVGGPTGRSMQELLRTFACAFQAGCQCN